MCNDGYLNAEGHGRGTRYYLPGLAANVGSNVGSSLGSNVGRIIKKRMSKEELQEVIVNACPEWVSLEYIATSIGRKIDYLQNHVIPLMLEEGLIERMYPKTPRHPNQKYKKTNRNQRMEK
jgi:hypothetical protein